MGRKPPVVVDQTTYLRVIKELHKAGEPWVVMADLSEHLNVTEPTARRRLDGLVAQDILEVRPGHLRSYRVRD